MSNWDNVKKLIGIEIKKARQNSNLTQEQLGVAIDVDWRSVQRFEYGIDLPKQESMFKLAKALDVHPATFLEKAYSYWLEEN